MLTEPVRPLEALEQQGFVDACARLLPRARASGHRLVVALYLVLVQHPPRSVAPEEGVGHLTCAECRPQDRGPREQYPCPTARQAYWALEWALAGTAR